MKRTPIVTKAKDKNHQSVLFLKYEAKNEYNSEKIGYQNLRGGRRLSSGNLRFIEFIDEARS